MITVLPNQYDQPIIEMYETYYKDYYGSEFMPDQGLDEITDMINKYSQGGSWVDFGGGVTSFFWLAAFNGITNVLSIDKHREAQMVQEKYRGNHVSGCYEHVLRRYGKKVEELRCIPFNYACMDIFESISDIGKFKNVSQFGLLGLLKNQTSYLSKLSEMIMCLDNQAVFFGANWIFSDRYASTKGFENSYMNVKLLNEFFANNCLNPLEAKLVNISNDPYYNSVLMYAFSR